MEFRLTSSWLSWMNPLNWYAKAKEGFYLKNSYLIGNKGPVWVDVDKPYELYNTVPQVRTIIDRGATMFSNMQIRLHDANGEDITDKASELFALLEKPNPLNSQNSFLFTFKRQHWVYGNQYIYKNQASRLDKFPRTLQNISPRFLTPYLTGNVWDQVEIEGIIEYYEEVRTKGTKKYEPKTIMPTIIQDIDNPLIGISPLVSLRYPISNTVAAYKFLNVISENSGAMGALVGKGSSGQMSGTPLTPEEKKRIQDNYLNSYGINDGQMRIILTEAEMDWKPFGYPTKQLLLLEQIDSNFRVMCDLYGMPINLFASKDSTYENVKQSIIQCYQDTIQPQADSFLQDLTRFLQVEKYYGKGAKLCASYDYMPILKEDKSKGVEAFKNMVDALANAVTNGIITAAYAKQIIDSEIQRFKGE